LQTKAHSRSHLVSTFTSIFKIKTKTKNYILHYTYYFQLK
jgi:hypothetical protein